jgi:hypothetical protein
LPAAPDSGAEATAAVDESTAEASAESTDIPTPVG